MNNLLYFRKLSKIDVKLLSKALNITVHTYIGFEQEKMLIPNEVKCILAMIYDIDIEELFCESAVLCETTRMKVEAMGKYDVAEMEQILCERLLGSKSQKLNYKTVRGLKNRLSTQ